MLEVVDDDERARATSEVPCDRAGRRLVMLLVEAEPGGDGADHEAGIGDWRQIDEGRPTGRRARRDGEGGLSRPARPRERDEPGLRAAEERRDRRELELATDERRWWGRRRRVGGARGREARVVLEDAPLERAELRGGLEAELVECRPSVAVGGEGICLAPRPIEGDHLVGAEPLPMGVGGDERLELRCERGVASRAEIVVDSGSRARPGGRPRGGSPRPGRTARRQGRQAPARARARVPRGSRRRPMPPAARSGRCRARPARRARGTRARASRSGRPRAPFAARGRAPGARPRRSRGVPRPRSRRSGDRWRPPGWAGGGAGRGARGAVGRRAARGRRRRRRPPTAPAPGTPPLTTPS